MGPGELPAYLEMALSVWLEIVVLWINRSYTWQADQAIPSCWPRQPHIVHEIAVLASLRLAAGHALAAGSTHQPRSSSCGWPN